MIIKQKKFSNKHTYTFEDDTFNFAYKDKSGSDDFDVEYAEFPEKSSLSIEQNEWLRNVGILWGLLGCFEIGNALLKQTSLSGTGFWLLVGITCLLGFYFTKVKYSIFKTKQGSVYIIQDGEHDKIIDELLTRRKKQLLDWYGDVNLNNELEVEINKFNWLVTNNAMSKQEAEEKIAQAEYAHRQENEQHSQLN